MNTMLSPQQRALLQGVAIPDLALSGLPSIKLLQSNSPDLLDSPDNSFYLPNATPGGFAIPSRDGRIFLPKFRFGMFGWSQEFTEYEAIGDDLQFVASHNLKPDDAQWRVNPASGRKECRRDSNDNVVQEVISCHMRVVETGQLSVFRFSKTALRPARELANSSQRLKLEGEDDIKSCILGVYEMTSRLEKQDSRRWFLPVATLISKLGAIDGPSLASVLELAELRRAFKTDLPPMLELLRTPEPPPQYLSDIPPPSGPDDYGARDPGAPPF